MKAVLLSGFGGVDVLKIGEAPRPKPAEGQVLVKVAATTVNRPDLVQRQGNYPPPPGDSEILGLEVAGTIEELGPGGSGWKVGDRVLSLVGGGAYAELAVAYASHLMAIPASMSCEDAACVCESYITAFLIVFMIGGLKCGNTAILLAGIKAELHLALMMVKRQQIIGSVLRSRPVKDKAEIVAEFTRTALPKFADRTIVPIVEKVFPLDQVVEAHRMMEEDRHFGKIVLKVS